MKLCRYGSKGNEKPGMIDHEGTLRSLSGHLDDIDSRMLTNGSLAWLRTLDPTLLPLVKGEQRYGVPLAGIGKVIAIGLNYHDHAVESNLPIPTEPMMFMKAISSLSGPYDDVILPKNAMHGDWEVELGVVIGKTCSYVKRADALEHIAGYVLVNDVSERFNQKQRGTQWSKGKGHDTFCPVGPWLVTPDEISDPQDLAMELDVNGVRMQTGNTRTMIFPVDELISYVSEYVTLEPGDLVINGTPPGVGEGKKPDAVYLKPGDTMRLSIAKLGQQSQSVAAWTNQRTGAAA